MSRAIKRPRYFRSSCIFSWTLYQFQDMMLPKFWWEGRNKIPRNINSVKSSKNIKRISIGPANWFWNDPYLDGKTQRCSSYSAAHHTICIQIHIVQNEEKTHASMRQVWRLWMYQKLYAWSSKRIQRGKCMQNSTLILVMIGSWVECFIICATLRWHFTFLSTRYYVQNIRTLSKFVEVFW